LLSLCFRTFIAHDSRALKAASITFLVLSSSHHSLKITYRNLSLPSRHVTQAANLVVVTNDKAYLQHFMDQALASLRDPEQTEFWFTAIHDAGAVVGVGAGAGAVGDGAGGANAAAADAAAAALMATPGEGISVTSKYLLICVFSHVLTPFWSG
jgi:hypothetical protein